LGGATELSNQDAHIQLGQPFAPRFEIDCFIEVSETGATGLRTKPFSEDTTSTAAMMQN
jgi:hypothetical protein